MAHRIQNIKARNNYILEAMFFGGELKRYDISSLFEQFPRFRVLENDQELFEKVVVDNGGYGISWNDDLDLDAETIWDAGILIEKQTAPSFNHLLAHRLLQARESANMTQKELSEKTGIYQSDISKLERGIGNPSIATLKRLAEGLEMELHIDFIVRDKKLPD